MKTLKLIADPTQPKNGEFHVTMSISGGSPGATVIGKLAPEGGGTAAPGNEAGVQEKEILLSPAGNGSGTFCVKLARKATLYGWATGYPQDQIDIEVM